jgi:DNA primase
MEMYVAPEFWGQYDFKGAHQILTDEAINIAPLEEYREFKTVNQVFTEWPAYYLDSFKPVKMFVGAVEYLKKRNVSPEAIEKHDLRFDSSKDMIVCPYWNVFGKLAGARGRSIHDHASGEEKHFDYRCKGINNARFVWYNEQALNLPGPVVVVEGQFDTWRVEAGWPKVLGNLTAKPTLEKFKRLADAEEVVVIPDNDETGKISKDTYTTLAREFGVKVHFVDLPEGVKDPDECHPQYLQERVEDALQK